MSVYWFLDVTILQLLIDAGIQVVWLHKACVLGAHKLVQIFVKMEHAQILVSIMGVQWHFLIIALMEHVLLMKTDVLVTQTVQLTCLSDVQIQLVQQISQVVPVVQDLIAQFE